MRDIDILADFIRERHEHPSINGGVDDDDLYHALVEALDGLKLGDIYRDFCAAMGGDAAYALNEAGKGIVRIVSLEEEVGA